MIDDEEYNIEAAKSILKYGIGISDDSLIVSCTSGQDAINIVKDDVLKHNFVYCSFKLILVDQNMPELDGNNTSRLIREYLFKQNIKQPIISSITGHTE